MVKSVADCSSRTKRNVLNTLTVTVLEKVLRRHVQGPEECVARAQTGNVTDKSLNRNMLEVVAVRLRKISSPSRRTGKPEYENLCGVLWIKVVGGIAYRHGYGYVKKEMWDKQEPKLLDLIFDRILSGTNRHLLKSSIRCLLDKSVKWPFPTPRSFA